MTTMGERIELIITRNGLKKVEFARKLGIDQSYVTKLLKGEKFKPSESLVKLICREFGVSEDWLRTGDGEMYAKKTDDALDCVLDKYALPRELRGLFLGYLGMSDNAKAELRGMLLRWLEDATQSVDAEHSAPVQLVQAEPTEPEDFVPLSDAEIEAKVAEYRALLKKGRAVRLALGHGTPPQTKAYSAFSNSGDGETGSSGDDIA